MNKLECPNCGTPTAFTPVFLSRDAVLDYVTGTIRAASSHDAIPAVMPNRWRGFTFAIVECQACSNLFIASLVIEERDRTWTAVYPIPHKTVAAEIPEPIKSQFEEANLCFAICANRASVVSHKWPYNEQVYRG